jgi:hypothetical protein
MKRTLLLVTLVACGKSSSDSNHYGNWKAADTKAALQGAWVGPSPSNLINHAAYEITGDKVKVWDGTAEKAYDLVLDGPCQLGLHDSSDTTAYMGVVMKDGKLTWGGGDAGVRTGDTAVMCAGLSTWSVEKGKCFEKFGKSWKAADGKCGFRQKDGKDEFFWTWGNKEDSRALDGDTLIEFKDDPAKKMSDYAAAKAALAAK